MSKNEIEKKGKSFIKEFKEFAVKGNVVDMAVGVIIGGAFTAIVTALVNNVIMPLITLLTKGIAFSEWFVALDGKEYATLAEATDAGASVLAYGELINAVLNFLIVAFVIFLVVKGINRLKSSAKKDEPVVEEEPTTKVCPYCKSEIAIDATRCPHCTSEVE